MPAIAAVVLGDGSPGVTGYSAGTEGVHTFSPAYMDSLGVMTWYLMESGNTLDSREKITLSVKQPAKGSQVARVVAKVTIPVMDGSTPPVKIGEGIATMEFVIPKTMTDLQRYNLWAKAVNFMAGTGTVTSNVLTHSDQNGFVQSGVADLQSPY